MSRRVVKSMEYLGKSFHGDMSVYHWRAELSDHPLPVYWVQPGRWNAHEAVEHFMQYDVAKDREAHKRLGVPFPSEKKKP